MDEFNTGTQYLGLILARVMGVLFSAPVFSAQGLSGRARMLLALFIAMVLYPTAREVLPDLPEGPVEYALEAMSQGLIGIIIGFMITIIFSAFQAAGQVFSVQMGLSFSEVLDPQAQISVPVIGTLKGMIGLLLFLVVDFQVDGHYFPAYMHVLRALGESFAGAPTLFADLNTLRGLAKFMDQSLGVMFITALKIGIPIMGILFISSATLGLMGRAAPQMNLMNMGIQLNIIVGLFVLFTLLPVVVPIMTDAFHRTYVDLGELMKEWPRVKTDGGTTP